MLKSFCKGAAALAVVLSFSTAAQAEEHVVMIAEGAYFPNVVFAVSGDQLTFVNQTSSSQTVNGDDDSWTSGALATEESFTLELTDETPSGFFGGGDAVGQIVFQ
jgi:plastocyanin